MNKPLPFIGWKACDEAFYLDAIRITNDEALAHWRKGTAVFLPNAVKQMQAQSGR